MNKVSEELHDGGEGISVVDCSGSQCTLDGSGSYQTGEEQHGAPLEEPAGGEREALRMQRCN